MSRCAIGGLRAVKSTVRVNEQPPWRVRRISSSACSGATKARAASSICTRRITTSSRDSAAAITPGTRSSSASQELALRIVPSGVLHPHVELFIGGGTVVNPDTLLEELDALSALGVDVARVKISDRAHVVLPHHIERDAAGERARASAIGTTGRGIGPAYVDRVARTGILFGEFARSAEGSRLAPHVVDGVEYIHDRAQRRQARVARRRAGLAARRRLRHVSLRHELAHDRRRSVHRPRDRAERDRPRDRRAQGLLHARRRRAVSVGAARRTRRAAATAGRRVRHRHRTPATLRLVRRRRGAVCRRAQRPHERRRSPSSTCLRASNESESSRAIA